jgi:ABC-type multidrug transport system fused ATPase/permease subunit
MEIGRPQIVVVVVMVMLVCTVVMVVVRMTMAMMMVMPVAVVVMVVTSEYKDGASIHYEANDRDDYRRIKRNVRWMDQALNTLPSHHDREQR